MSHFKKPLLLATGLAALGCATFALAQPYAYVPNYAGNSVTVIDTSTNLITANIPVGTDPSGVAVNGAATRVFVVNRTSRTVSVIDTGTNTVIATIPVGVAPQGIALSPDGSRAYVANANNDNVTVIDALNHAVLTTVTVGDNPQGVTFSPSGSYVYVANKDSNNVSVIHALSNSVSATIAVGAGPVGVDVSPSGGRLYVGNSLDATLSVVDTSNNLVVGTIALGTPPYGVAVNPSGSHVYVGTAGGNSTLSVISTATNSITATVPVSSSHRGLSFNPAGTFAYLALQGTSRVAVINAVTHTLSSTINVVSPRPLGEMTAQPLFGQGSIAAGHNHTCRIRPDNTVDCWGRNDNAQSDAPGGGFMRVVAGSSHTCGLRTDATVVCWGDNSRGQTNAPIGTFSQIASGFRHTCGLRPNGDAECWGDDDQGQAAAPAGTFAQLRAGSSHSCGILMDGSATCWGRNVDGQASPPVGNFIQLALGASFSCGLRVDGTATCWGSNTDGRATALGGTFTQIVAEANYVCGLRPNDSIECWGTNAYGQTSAPTGSFAQIASGRFHACALKQDGRVQCWGDSAFYNQAPQFDLTPAVLPAGQVAQPYSQSISFTVINPGIKEPYVPVTPAYVLEGTLPSGLSMDASGNITGTPDAEGNYNFTVVVQDANGFSAERNYSVGISLSAPIITPEITGNLGNNGWYIGNVTIGWNVTDPETPVTSSTGCGTSVQSVNTAGTVYTCEATSDGGTSSVSVTIKLDKTKPTLSPSISNNRPLLNDATVVATPNGADALSGVATQSCPAIDTSTIGLKQVVCTVTDVAGNIYTKPISYRVIHGFEGFTGGVVNPGLWNSATLGQLIDFDFRLVDANGNGVEGAAVPSFSSTAIACPVNVANVTVASGDAPGLQDLGNGYYRFVWAAPGSPACVRLNLNTGDGQTDRRAVFRFE